MTKYVSETVLAADVASPAGTFTVAYPSGTAQADFQSPFSAATAYMVVNNNDHYDDGTPDKFDISYGASNITITNKTGATLKAGANVKVGLGRTIGAYTATGTYATDSPLLQSILNELVTKCRKAGVDV